MRAGWRRGTTSSTQISCSTKKTKAFITEHRSKTPKQPFFVVLSTQIAHAPVLPADEFKGATNAGPRGDFVWELDTLVGAY